MFVDSTTRNLRSLIYVISWLQTVAGIDYGTVKEVLVLVGAATFATRLQCYKSQELNISHAPFILNNALKKVVGGMCPDNRFWVISTFHKRFSVRRTSE